MIGPHLLGRIPNAPDERDWKLETILKSDASLRDQALAQLHLTKRGWVDARYVGPPGKSSIHWNAAVAALSLIGAPPPPPPPSGAVVWEDTEPILDQGDTGTCVGNAWAQWGNTNPVDDKYAESDARGIYLEATTIYYGKPDTSLQQGCDTRSGVKAMQNRGRLAAYAFASTTAAITAWLQAKGPVVTGTDWYNDMFDPDADGILHPSGGIAGGHEWLLCGYDPNYKGHGPCYKMRNSWGASWGIEGHAYIKVADYGNTLLVGNGDACVTLEVAA